VSDLTILVIGLACALALAGYLWLCEAVRE
jgi:hypothetical protein